MMTFSRGLDISNMTIRRLINLMEHLLKSNTKDEIEKSRLMADLYSDEDSQLSNIASSGRQRRSGREKLANYANKQRSSLIPQVPPEVPPELPSPLNTPKRKEKKTPPPGFGMSLAQAEALMKSASDEDSELLRRSR